jgi:myosin heavy subunit
MCCENLLTSAKQQLFPHIFTWQALKVRFQTDKIYTNIGDILISMNPFKMLPLYTPNVMQEFLNQQVKIY